MDTMQEKSAGKAIATAEDNIAITQVPLASLTPSPENVRRFHSEAGLASLMASIRSQGLLQNLNVRKKGKKFEVVAGARRLAVLKKLAKEKDSGWTNDSLVAVKILAVAENASEVSLAENIVREDMHPADQIEAFRALIEDQAMTPEEIGDRFGISHMTVRRRVKLAKVSPYIMKRFRAGEVSLQEMEAYAVSDDHAAQEQVHASLQSWQRTPDTIRASLTASKIALDHRLVHFIGVSAYESAGGTITRDLFAEEGGAYLDDKALVVRLATEKIAAEAEAIRRVEGWKWAEGYLSLHDARSNFSASGGLDYTHREFTDAEEEELSAIAEWMDTREAEIENGDLSDEDAAEYEQKQERISQLEAARIIYDPDEIPLAGVRAYIDQNGKVGVRRGYLKPEDAHELAARKRLVNDEADADEATLDEATLDEVSDHESDKGYSTALIAELTALKGASLAVAVSKRPDVALALLVHKLALRLFYNGGFHTAAASCLTIDATSYMATPKATDPDNAAPIDALCGVKSEIRALLPDDASALFAWCVDADHKTLLRVLAYCVGSRLDIAVQTAGPSASRMDRDKTKCGNQIARLVGLDMVDHWTPSEAFCKRTTKKQMAEAVTEAGNPPQAARCVIAATKTEAVTLTLKALRGKRWLPATLRVPVPIDAPKSEPEADEADPTPAVVAIWPETAESVVSL